MPESRSGIEVEVAVIGGGLAGVMAALAARGEGKTVGLVRQGPGATAMGTGLISLSSRHPALAQVALDAFVLACADSGLSHAQDRAESFFPAADGRWLAAHLAPWQLAEGELNRLRQGRTALALVPGMWPPGPEISDLLGEVPDGGSSPDLVTFELDLAHLVGHGDLSPSRLAWWLEDDDQVSRLIEAVRASLPAAVVRLGIPAVMGRHLSGGPLTRLGLELGLPVFELASPPPSLPGFRLQMALDLALAEAGVSVYSGARCSRPRSESGIVQSLELESRTLHAGAYVLATGRFLGGGVRRWPHPHEELFGLPCFLGPAAAEGLRPDALVSSSGTGGSQPIFRVGVRADPDGRPCDDSGTAPYQNLWAAGSVLAGSSSSEARGAGDAIASGWKAGLKAAGYSR